jgi:hypothetical protein
MLKLDKVAFSGTCSWTTLGAFSSEWRWRWPCNEAAEAKLIFVRERSKKGSPRYLLRNFILKKRLSGVMGLTSKALRVV